MELKDDRTQAERKTHSLLVGGNDSFMSGWGSAKGGISYAFWACTFEQVDKVEQWVRSRGDIKYARIQSNPPRGHEHDHCHIYTIKDGHPALGGV